MNEMLLKVFHHSITHWTLCNVLAPLTHVGTVLDGRTSFLFSVPSAVWISGTQTVSTNTQTQKTGSYVNALMNSLS